MSAVHDTDRWRRIDEVFEAVLSCPPGERDACLARLCDRDSELRVAVERLLTIDEKAQSFLETPAHLAGDDASDRPEAGLLVGPYKLLRRLGSGGMGSVYLAARIDGQFEHQVAVKLIRPGTAGEELDRRLRLERQLLARLEHPNIARLYDGGSAADGRSYLVMELVEGLPITDYSRRQDLSLEEILRLVLQVCAAVAYAHRNLVVHRDLKPSNLLVTEDGMAKLLDFGIAKLLAPEPTGEGAERTMTGRRLMTPSYASPEQVAGKPVTTASDVYALGVLLYRLLTGRMPYRLEQQTPLAFESAILGQEPARPSASAAGASPPIPASRLKGDLDTIVLKALRKEPEERYASVEQLAADLHRHLEERPILGRAPTWRYRARKFVRRNRLASAVASVALVGAIALTTALATQVRHTTQQRDKAELALEFMVGLFGSAGPTEELPDARDLLESGVERVETELAGQAALQSEVLERIINVYIHLSRYQRANELTERLLELRLELYGPGHPMVWQARGLVAELKVISNDLRGARALYEELLAEATERHGATSDEALEVRFMLALVHQNAGEYQQALDINQENLAIRQQRLKAHSPVLGWPYAVVGGSLNGVGRYDEAERAYERALPLIKELYGASHRYVAQVLNNSSLVLINQERFVEAEKRLLEAQAIQEALLDEQHQDRGFNWINLGEARHGLGKSEAAEEAIERGLSILRQHLGDGHRGVAGGLLKLAAVHFDRDDSAAAERHYRDALDSYRLVALDEHPGAGKAMIGLGRALAAQGHRAEASDFLLRGQAVLENGLRPDHPTIAIIRRQVAEALAQHSSESAQ